jgi:hypothetical protein
MTYHISKQTILVSSCQLLVNIRFRIKASTSVEDIMLSTTSSSICSSSMTKLCIVSVKTRQHVQFPAMMRIIVSFLLLISLSTATSSNLNGTNKCSVTNEMIIWVYRTSTACENYEPPDGIGTIIADGLCHQSEINTYFSSEILSVSNKTSTQSSKLYNSMLPGNYRAICTTTSNTNRQQPAIQFIESGCIDSKCSIDSEYTSTSRKSSSSVTANKSNDICTMNSTIVSSLYTQSNSTVTNNNTYPLQQINTNISTIYASQRLYTCSTIRGSTNRTKNLSITFAIFGDCSSTSIATTTCTDENNNHTQNITTITESPPAQSPISATTNDSTTSTAAATSSSSSIFLMTYPVYVVGIVSSFLW